MQTVLKFAGFSTAILVLPVVVIYRGLEGAHSMHARRARGQRSARGGAAVPPGASCMRLGLTETHAAALVCTACRPQ
jgi:hypothetical protein